MTSTKTLIAAAALPLLGACGVPLEEYDARTAELRKAEDRAGKCDTNVKQEEAKIAELQAGLEEMKATVRDLQGHQLSDTDKSSFQRLQADASRTRQEAAERKAERESLTRNLKDELEGGMIWLDERKGRSRIVIPEEVLFSSTGSSISETGKKVLDSVSRELKALPERQVMIAAYLDRGPKSKPKEDLSLTVDRAKKVSDYIIKKGVEPERVATAGWGGADPIADNASDDQRTRNRRVEVHLVVMPAPGGAPAMPPGAPSVSTPSRPPVSAPLPPPSVARPTPTPPPSRVVIPPPPVAPPAGSAEDPGL
jgi:chemotaxis protein MotB